MDHAFASKQERVAHQKKIRLWFMNPVKFKKELDAEIKKYAGKCVYHLCDNHPTSSCNVKRECDKLIADKGSTSQASSATGQLRHISEETFEDAVELSTSEVDLDDFANDTNEESLHYFACITNHYLRLVRSSNQVNPRHQMKCPIIADSGANYHMFKDLEFFNYITPATGRVVLGDGKTSLNIEGIGSVNLKFGETIITVDNVRYIPSLSESIYSLFLHIQRPGHAVHSSFDDGLSINFPNLHTKAIIGTDDIYLDAVPPTIPADRQALSLVDCHNNTSSDASQSNLFCRHVKQFQQDVSFESSKVDNLLTNLRQYYKEVKTKRQLNLEVPAGFRRDNNLLRTVKDAQLYESAQYSDINDQEDTLPFVLQSTDESCPNSDTISVSSTDTTVHMDNTSNRRVPILRCIDKASSSIPSRLTLSEDFIRASMGFRRVDTLKRNLSTLYQDTITLDTQPCDAILDPGDLATLRKTPRNTTPVARPASFGDVIHVDIVFGPEVALANVHYGLIFTDRFSRMTYIFPLKNLIRILSNNLIIFLLSWDLFLEDSFPILI